APTDPSRQRVMREMLETIPSATRKTNPYSGTAGSAPGIWNTWLNTSAETPSAEPNESTTVPMSMSGAITERNNNMRIARITTNTIGMISVRSRMEALLESTSVALTPPTSVSIPASANSDRNCSTTSPASVESAATVRVASSSTSPSETVGSGAGASGGPTGWTP